MDDNETTNTSAIPACMTLALPANRGEDVVRVRVRVRGSCADRRRRRAGIQFSKEWMTLNLPIETLALIRADKALQVEWVS